MKLEYDKEADAAYIYLKFPIQPGEAKKTVELNEDINVDFDDSGKMLGIEVLEASKHLTKSSISEAILK